MDCHGGIQPIAPLTLGGGGEGVMDRVVPFVVCAVRSRRLPLLLGASTAGWR